MKRTWPSTSDWLPVTGSPLGQARVWLRRPAATAGTWLVAGRRRGACPVPRVSREAVPERGWDFCLEHHVSRLHQIVWLRVPARDRVGGLRQLKARGWWKELPPRGRSGGAVDPAQSPQSAGCWISSRLCRNGAEPVAHRENAVGRPPAANASPSSRHLVNLQEACDRRANDRGRGVMNAMDVVEKKKGSAKAQKIPVVPGVDDRRARPGRGCRNGQHGRPRPIAGRDDDREPRALPV